MSSYCIDDANFKSWLLKTCFDFVRPDLGPHNCHPGIHHILNCGNHPLRPQDGLETCSCWQSARRSQVALSRIKIRLRSTSVLRAFFHNEITTEELDQHWLNTWIKSVQREARDSRRSNPVSPPAGRPGGQGGRRGSRCGHGGGYCKGFGLNIGQTIEDEIRWMISLCKAGRGPVLDSKLSRGRVWILTSLWPYNVVRLASVWVIQLFRSNVMLFIQLLHLFKSINTSNTTYCSLFCRDGRSINTRKSYNWRK